MRLVRPLILALGIALMVPPGDAYAACADNLKQVKELFKTVRDVRKRDLLKREISAADTAIKRKSESSCKRSVANAQRILRSKT